MLYILLALFSSSLLCKVWNLSKVYSLFTSVCSLDQSYGTFGTFYDVKTALFPTAARALRWFPIRMVYLYYIYIMLEIHHSGRKPSYFLLCVRYWRTVFQQEQDPCPATAIHHPSSPLPCTLNLANPTHISFIIKPPIHVPLTV